MRLKSKLLWSYMAFVVIMLCSNSKIAATTSGGIEIDRPDEKIFVGYEPSTYREFTGYDVEYFGFGRAHYSRTVRTYDTLPCCNPTANKMDGCSAPVICPRNN